MEYGHLMRISTIMAAYNCERYVAQALESVLAQTLPSDEIIVVDDGSTDATPDVLRKFATHVRIIRQQNYGAARALNAGIAESNGDALAFIDSDDLWLPEKLRLQSAMLSTERELEAVFGMMQQFISPDIHPETAGQYVVPNSPQPGISKDALLVRRDGFERIGPFNEEVVVTDFVDWYARAIALDLRWRMLPEVVALRRHHPGNTGRQNRLKQQAETLQALKQSLEMRRRR
jgi:glycosyltransferase involved in cell wall biosynthesis